MRSGSESIHHEQPPSSMASKAKDLASFINDLGLRRFKGQEIAAYATRKRGQIVNSLPHESLWPNIVPTLIVADELREVIDVPLTITSAYRSPMYNRAVGGERNSYHMQFKALDLVPQGATPRALAAAARKLRGRKFKIPGTNDSFVFRGGIGTYETFVHIDTRGYDANW